MLHLSLKLHQNKTRSDKKKKGEKPLIFKSFEMCLNLTSCVLNQDVLSISQPLCASNPRRAFELSVRRAPF